MKHLLNLSVGGAFFGLAMLVCTPSAQASEWNKATKVEVRSPVDLQGVALEPGQYIFKLMGGTADRRVMQVYNASNSHIVTTVIAMPAYRVKTPDRTRFTYYEAPSGHPEAIRNWFYPGDNSGLRFLPPKDLPAPMRSSALAGATRAGE